MLVQMLRRLPWQLACVLFAVVATVEADVESSSNRPHASFRGQIRLLARDVANSTELVPMTDAGIDKSTFDGSLYLTTDSNLQNITSGTIPLISCDRYNGNLQAQNVFQNVLDNKNPPAAIFYSTTVDYCNYTDPTDQIRQFPMYSIAGASVAQQLVSGMQNRSSGTDTLPVLVQRSPDRSGTNNGNPNENPATNPLGPSPSTAVAMIILYSITGIITALFLVIIVTGAVRAHRHPDRYGPRDVLGRPRQSRARGLGRAILDTLPIVKFGEKEPPKPTDVELGSTPEPRAVGDDATTTANTDMGETNAVAGTTQVREATATEPSTDATTQRQGEGLEGGIAPAQSMAIAAAATTTQNETPADEGLGCSICTDDFEKGQDIRVLPCNHKFHPECVDPWLLNVSGTCPLCRVDLHPVTSNTSNGSEETEGNTHLSPPLQPDNDPATRRRSGLRDILSFRTRPNASPDERIYALRRLREQRRNGSGDVNGASGSADDLANRRNNRMSTRLTGVFGGRRRGRDESPQPHAATQQAGAAGESTSSSAGPQSSSNQQQR